MKTNYKYINFVWQILPEKRKTKRYACYNKAECIGVVEWFARWRQYCFFPCDGTVFSKGCLDDIADFIKQLMDERNKK